jgi:hypothetical protein
MLRGSAALLTGGAVGAAAFREVAQPTTARATASLAIDGDDTIIRTGTLQHVWLNAAVAWSYAVPSGENPKTAEIELLAGTEPDALSAVASHSEDAVFLESSGEQSFEVDLLGDVLDASALVPDEGGTTTETTVHVAVRFRVLDGSGAVIAAADASDTATLAVTKSSYDPQEYGDVSGSGELTLIVE